ncbi:MAG: cytochrome c-type biogenesis protein CcmH [Acidimicrobiia bacterium]
MSERTRSLTFAGILVALATVLVVLVATSPSDVDRVESIGQRIKCPVCQGESIADSPSTMARDMMDLITERVDAGFTDQAIIDELLESYSGALLLDPPTGGATLLLWLAPLGALAVGVVVILWWRRHPREEADGEEASPPRRLAPTVVLGVAFVAIVVVATMALRDQPGPAAGVADLSAQDLSEVSNETMEAVIASNLDNPQIDGMRLALAERYFQSGDYKSAFPHYLAVAESGTASADEVVAALVRLGWMVWDGNAEAEAAINLFDQALEVNPGSSTAKYLKAEVLWCGLGDTTEAATLFQDVLADPNLNAEARAQVETSLEDINSGVGCR